MLAARPPSHTTATTPWAAVLAADPPATFAQQALPVQQPFRARDTCNLRFALPVHGKPLQRQPFFLLACLPCLPPCFSKPQAVPALSNCLNAQKHVDRRAAVVHRAISSCEHVTASTCAVQSKPQAGGCAGTQHGASWECSERKIDVQQEQGPLDELQPAWLRTLPTPRPPAAADGESRGSPAPPRRSAAAQTHPLRRDPWCCWGY